MPTSRWLLLTLAISPAAFAATSLEVLRVDDLASTGDGWSNSGAANFQGTLARSPRDRSGDSLICDKDETFASTKGNGKLISSLSDPRYLEDTSIIVRLRVSTQARNSTPGKSLGLMVSLDGQSFSHYTVISLPSSYFPMDSGWLTERLDGEPFTAKDLSSLRFVAESRGTPPGDWRLSKAFAQIEFLPRVPADCAQAQPLKLQGNRDPVKSMEGASACDGNGEAIGFGDQQLVFSDFLLNMATEPRFEAVSLDFTYRVSDSAVDDTLTLDYSFDGFASATRIEGPLVPATGTYDRKLILPASACPGGVCDSKALRQLALRFSSTSTGEVDSGRVALDCARAIVTPVKKRCDPILPGRAASYTLAEVHPNAVEAGACAATLEYLLQPSVSTALKDTGVNVVTLGLGAGWSAPELLSVDVGGLALSPGVDFKDTSAATVSKTDLQLSLSPRRKLTARQVLRVRLKANAPARADKGTRFTCTVDDSATAKVAPQPCIQGNALAVFAEEGDLNSLRVVVTAPRGEARPK